MVMLADLLRPARPTRPSRSVPTLRHRNVRHATLALLTATLLGLTVFALSSAATGAAAPDATLAAAEEAGVSGGTCGSSCDSGGSSSNDDPSPSGSSYWVTTNQNLRSYDRGVAELVYRYNNWSNSDLNHEFTVQRRVSRSVGFSGGFADYFRVSVGGEINRTYSWTDRKVIGPYEGLKVYRRQETRRYDVYGTRYQDYDDGSRKVVGRSSGPYTTSNSVLGFVSVALR